MTSLWLWTATSVLMGGLLLRNADLGLWPQTMANPTVRLALEVAIWLAAVSLAWGALRWHRRQRGMHQQVTALEVALSDAGRRWQTLSELAGDRAWETDPEHRLVWVSDGGQLATTPGLRASDLLGRRFDQVAAFEPPGCDWDAWQEMLDAGRSFRNVELRVRGQTPSEHAVWLSVSGRPRRDATGQLLGFEGVVRDVSERRVADASLRASEQRWSLMAGLATDYYWETDTDHRLLPLRPEVARRLTRLADIAEGRAPWEAFPDAMDPAHWDEYRQDIAARRPFQAVEFDIDIGNDRRSIVALSGIPRFDGQGQFLGYHGIGRDITMRREAERLLMRHHETLQRSVAERTEALERVNRDLDAFARQLAHELRTPIAHVRGLTQLMESRLKDQLGADGQMLIDMQLRATQHMQDTVDALLLLARSTMQAMPMQTIDLTALARDVIAGLPQAARAAPVRWQVAEGLSVHAAPAALRIVLANLLGNAAKFTRDVTRPQVWVEGRVESDGWLCLSVRDNGAGFDGHQAGRLFLPFSRLHSAERFGGTGIGLTIVQRIIERHGGQVRAQGTVGAGAQFEVTLPLGRTADADAAPTQVGAAAVRAKAVATG